MVEKDIDDANAKELLNLKNEKDESVFHGFKPVRCLTPCTDCGKDVVTLLTEYKTTCRDCWKKIEEENPTICKICGKEVFDEDTMIRLDIENLKDENSIGENHYFCSKNCLKEFVGEL